MSFNTKLPLTPNRWLVCIPDPDQRGSYTKLMGDCDTEEAARRLMDELVEAGNPVQIYHTCVILEHVSWTPANSPGETLVAPDSKL